MGMRANQRATEARDRGELAGSAMRVLIHHVAHGHPLPAATVARVRSIGRTAPDLRTKRRAFELLGRASVDVTDDLAASDPEVRLAAADAVGQARS
jgi:hypothetical protein